jgi:uncharacterized protein (TIGR02453 family)
MPITPASLTFLRQLKKNNRREWFEANRERYENDIRQPLRELVEEMDVRLAKIAPEMVGDPKRSIFRIHRDIRFSADKSPYKTNAACYFYHRGAASGVGENAVGGAGFYVHVEPGGSMVGGGYWRPPRPALNKLRERIAEDVESLEKSLGGPLKKRFGALSEEDMLKRVPRGYAPDHPAERWLRRQSFTTGRMLTDDEITSPQLLKELERDFAAMVPLVRWINETLGHRTASSR